MMGAHPKEQDRVVVTGFGPFGVHKVNASWVAVQQLKTIGLNDPFVNLIVEEIKVDYDHVKVIRSCSDLAGFELETTEE